MSLSRKYYQGIADAIGSVPNVPFKVVQNLESYFKADNPRFNPERFERAVQKASRKLGI